MDCGCSGTARVNPVSLNDQGCAVCPLALSRGDSALSSLVLCADLCFFPVPRSSTNTFVHLSVQAALQVASALSPSATFGPLEVTIVGSNDFYSQSRSVSTTWTRNLTTCADARGPLRTRHRFPSLRSIARFATFTRRVSGPPPPWSPRSPLPCSCTGHLLAPKRHPRRATGYRIPTTLRFTCFTTSRNTFTRSRRAKSAAVSTSRLPCTVAKRTGDSRSSAWATCWIRSPVAARRCVGSRVGVRPKRALMG